MSKNIVWIKLTGKVAEKFEEQRLELCEKNNVTESQFPREMFVSYMLDIREQVAQPTEIPEEE